MHNKEILNAEQTAKYLNLKNRKAVLHAWKNGRIPGTKINNKYLVSKRQLAEGKKKCWSINQKALSLNRA